MALLQTAKEIADMRESGRILALVLQKIQRYMQAGMTPKDTSRLAAQELERLGGKPVFKGQDGGPGAQPYPDIICISTNNEVQHGIPSSRPFRDGDIVNFDFGVNYNGMITDAGVTGGGR